MNGTRIISDDAKITLIFVSLIEHILRQIELLKKQNGEQIVEILAFRCFSTQKAQL